MTISIEEPQKLAGRIPSDICEALPSLVNYWVQQCHPLSNDAMTQHLGAMLRLMTGFQSPDERKETMGVLAIHLRSVPADLAADAIRHASVTCRHVSQVLPTITEYLEDYPARRRAQRDRYIALARVAGVLPQERKEA